MMDDGWLTGWIDDGWMDDIECLTHSKKLIRMV